MKEKTEKFANKVYRHIDLLAIIGTILIGCVWIHGEIQHQAVRTDRLYEMYCEMQKEIKDIYVMQTKEK